MIREDVHSFGLGAPSIYVEYHRHSAVALVTSLEEPSERHQSVTMHLLTHQVAQLKVLATTFLSTREEQSLPIKTACIRKGSQLLLTLARAPPETRKKRNNRD
jgi:hypothetical protein